MEGDEYPPHPKAVFLEQGFTGYPETLTPREEKVGCDPVAPGARPPPSRRRIVRTRIGGSPLTHGMGHTQLLASAKEQVPPREARALRFRGEQLDAMYCRFLRARKFDVQAACSMMRTAMVRGIRQRPTTRAP